LKYKQFNEVLSETWNPVFKDDTMRRSGTGNTPRQR